MKSFVKVLVTAIPLVLLVACASGDKAAKKGAAMPESNAATDTSRDVRSGIGISDDRGFSGNALDDPNGMLAKRVVYFDFDSSVVRDEFTAVIEAHAAYMAGHPAAKVTLEGHGDERGTREYNMALGERRAKAVRQFLMLQGASSGQLDVVSYGEERPVALGHEEDSWRLNRRVEIVYTSR
ncbi:MAG: palH [Gammaproteobacteria bacterium]|nr:MAG: palH [Gammaproteobacteria bacterium]TND04280.1 MAG: palH [Gammaproteobacteria bacterium]